LLPGACSTALHPKLLKIWQVPDQHVEQEPWSSS
jgi:hypothetical protein